MESDPKPVQLSPTLARDLLMQLDYAVGECQRTIVLLYVLHQAVSEDDPESNALQPIERAIETNTHRIDQSRSMMLQCGYTPGSAKPYTSEGDDHAN